MQILKTMAGVALAASLSVISCSDEDMGDCQAACSDASAACVANCTEEGCPAACEAARVSCVNDCQ